MNKIICQKCGGESFAEFGETLSNCKNCDARLKLSPEKETASFKVAATAPSVKKRLIYAAVLFAILSLPLLYFAGLYWFIIRQPKGKTDYSIKLPDWISPKPTPRTRKTTSISASEITRIEYTDSKHQKPEYATGYLSNYAMKNYFHRELIVALDDDGRATKYFVQQETVNGVGTPQSLERYTGAFAPERFVELARVFVANDFLGEEDSRTSTISPINQTLTVICSPPQRSKSFQTGNSNSGTPEAEAMLKAFKELENKIDWQRVQ